jgi:hypothetical protein
VLVDFRVDLILFLSTSGECGPIGNDAPFMSSFHAQAKIEQIWKRLMDFDECSSTVKSHILGAFRSMLAVLFEKPD